MLSFLAVSTAQELKFFASCWSPPAWMKTSGNLIGGTLKPGYEKQLALYFRNFIEAYEALNIPIQAITLQNEPNFLPPAYPGMKLSAEQERDISTAVYEEFHENLGDKRELNTEIWINDHNFEFWEKADRVLHELAQKGQKHVVKAVAFHNYSNVPVTAMTRLHELHPETDIQFTEHSEWGVSGMHNIQSYFMNWSRSYVYWVAMTTQKLDEHNQSPYNRIGELSPTLLVEKEDGSPDWYVTPEYYLLAQFAKFVRPGARRIYCDPGSIDQVSFVAFRNFDGYVAVVAVNQSNTTREFGLSCRGKFVNSKLPAKTVATLVWQD